MCEQLGPKETERRFAFYLLYGRDEGHVEFCLMLARCVLKWEADL